MIDIHKERALIDRSAALLTAAEAERDSELRAALFARCHELQGQAIMLQLARKQAALLEKGIPLQAP